MKPLSTPAAIVVGSGLMALGLYFGLRARAPSPVASPPPIATLTSGGTIAPPSTPGPSAPPIAPLPNGEFSASVKGQIAAQHAHLVEACWIPSLARASKPAQISMNLYLEYADDGRLSVRSLHQERLGGRADMTICVGKELVMPTVSAPGRTMSVNVPIAFP